MCQALCQILGIKPGLVPAFIELAANHTNIQLQTTTVFDPNEGKGRRTQVNLRG